MNKTDLGALFFTELRKITGLEIPDSSKLSRMYMLLNKLFVHFTKDENLQFTTSFARISFTCQKFEIDQELQWRIHHFRRLSQKVFFEGQELEETYFYAGLRVIAQSISSLFDLEIPEELSKLFPSEAIFKKPDLEIVSSKPFARVVLLDKDESNSMLIGRDEDVPENGLIRISYKESEFNELNSKAVTAIEELWKNNLTVNLLDIRIDQEGNYFPEMILLQPDYLVDVTAIAESFQSSGTEPRLYLLKKFLPFVYSVPLMLGHIANFFLDELMHDPEIQFADLFPKVFQLNPIAFTTFSNEEVKEIFQQSKRHFVNLKRQVKTEFPQQNIELENCFIEPSFYSEKYGIQGRLDVLHKPPEGNKCAIVELKSGSPFGQNRYGLSQTHYTQTLLYDLLIKSVYGADIDPAKYILYSKLEIDNLRFAPSHKIAQMEALQVRNDIMIMEKGLMDLDQSVGGNNILDELKPSKFPSLKGFYKRDLQLFSEILRGASKLERHYFMSFVSFIAKEHHLAKTGEEGVEHMNGMANLWLSPFQLKQENFDIISHLEIEENNSAEAEPIIVFRKSEKTNPLANFREGDIAVLYPSSSQKITVLDNQIFKCSIIHLDNKTVHVRLRARQSNERIFKEQEFWNLEHDLIDSSFTQLYRNLFEFLRVPKSKRSLLLGTRAPVRPSNRKIDLPSHLNSEQRSILSKALQAEDYFLLMGPPGTGKTKFMLREMVRWLYKNTDENILLLAYTNRAVDEICEAIDNITEERYIRIGSKYSTAEEYRDCLLQNLISGIKTRKELTHLLQSHRIFVGTVNSLMGKNELLALKKFDTLIIDEASQLLEPMLVSLLPKVQRFFLIGDHKQLPAVVRQPKELSEINDPILREIHLENRRNSLFERLYKIAVKNGWHWAYDMLKQQGRMHEEIADFPDQVFYQGKLESLETESGFGWQQKDLELAPCPETNELEQLLSSHRLLFIPSKVDITSISNKTNIHEAKLVCEIIRGYEKVYQDNKQSLKTESIGVITPYRAQIAQIRFQMEDCEIDHEKISVDTVERYQGGARDIIIISLCVNSSSQMETIVSLTDDGSVDRKLNVALTRARRHLVLIGNPELLRLNRIYAQLLDYIEEKNGILQPGNYHYSV